MATWRPWRMTRRWWLWRRGRCLRKSRNRQEGETCDDSIQFYLHGFCLVKSLAGNRNEDNFLAGVRDAKGCASGGVTPLPRLLRLITKTLQRLPRTVSKLQPLVASVKDDLRRASGNEFVGRHRSIDTAPTRERRQHRSCFGRRCNLYDFFVFVSRLIGVDSRE